MKKSIKKISHKSKRATILILLFLALLFSVNIFISKSKHLNWKLNISINSLLQKVSISKDVSHNKLLKGQSINFELKANDNNLGTVSFLLDNHENINSDVITFRIRETGANNWYYENKYDTSLVDVGQYFPFGFKPIAVSKNRYYEIEIISQNGSEDNSISLSSLSDVFIAKYEYSRKYLKHNPNLIPHFIIAKLNNSLSNIKLKDFLEILKAFAFPFLLYLVVLLVYKISKIFFPKIISIKYLALNGTEYLKKKVRHAWRIKKEIYFLILIYIATHIQFLGHKQYWDANWYWNLFNQTLLDILSVSNIFDFLNTYLTSFNILGHPSMGYISVLFLGQLPDIGNVALLNITNMILAIMATFSFHNIVTYYFPKYKLGNFLITAIFAFNPLFYATSISFSLDFPLIIFTTLMIDALIHHKKKLFVLWALLLSFSKETGILISLSFVSLYIAYNIIYLKNLQKIKDFIYKSKYLFIPTISVVLYMIYAKGNLWNYKPTPESPDFFSFSWNSNCQFCFGYNKLNINTRLFQMFIMNFQWILSLIIIFAVIKLIITRVKVTKGLSIEKNIYLITIISTFAIFVIFNLSIVVMNFSRYVVPGVFFLLFIWYISLNLLIVKRKYIKNILLLLVLALMFIQTFEAIDPSARYLFGTKYIGNKPISNIFWPNDALVYNTEFVFVEKLTNVINQNTPPTLKLVNDTHTVYFFRDIVSIGQIDKLETISNRDSYNNLRYIYVPGASPEKNVITEKIKEHYNITHTQTITYKGYTFELLDLEKI